MQLHHIIAESEGGLDTLDNCIPLCLDCHEEVGSYNPLHPIGRKFGSDELRQHRDLWFDFVKKHPERLNHSEQKLFRSITEVIASAEPYYHKATLFSADKGHFEKEVFAAKVRNKGDKAFVVDEIGFICENRRYKGVFTSYSTKDGHNSYQIEPGHSLVFSFFGVEIEKEDIPKMEGMYLITGAGDLFINHTPLERLITEFLNEESSEG